MRVRKYANFFEGPSKELKEFTVCEKWLNTYGAGNGYDKSSLVSVNDQWTDCEVKNNAGELCGIEVTELVDSEAIRRNEMGENVYRTWNNDDLLSAIHDRLMDKNTRTHGGKYSKLVVLLHTDELEITSDAYGHVIEGHIFENLENIDEAYMVYSYVPGKGYPVSVLNLGA